MGGLFQEREILTMKACVLLWGLVVGFILCIAGASWFELPDTI